MASKPPTVCTLAVREWGQSNAGLKSPPRDSALLRAGNPTGLHGAPQANPVMQPCEPAPAQVAASLDFGHRASSKGLRVQVPSPVDTSREARHPLESSQGLVAQQAQTWQSARACLPLPRGLVLSGVLGPKFLRARVIADAELGQRAAGNGPPTCK